MTATSHPTEGLGRYPLREQNHVYGTDKEQALFKPPSGFWPTAAVEAAKRQISFDLLLLPTGYADVVTMGQLCHLTNGQQAVFFNFTADNDTQRLTDFFGRSLLEEAGYAAILRVRCSAGIKVQGYHGHFMQTDPQDMDLACVQGSSTFLADLAHEGRLDKKGTALVQCALLYTSRRGGRRVRVHTLRMNVAEQYSTLYRHTDLEATTYSIICHGVHEAVNKGVKPAREYLQRRVADLLVGYRRHSNSSTNSGQLLLPEQLKLLPVYIMCTLKSDAFVQGTAVRLDDRMQNMFLLLGYPLDRLLYYLYPRLYPLHALAGNTGLAKYPGSALPVVMPPVLQLTADSVYVNGIYALVDMQANILFLWVGSQVPPKTLQQVFGTENPLEVNGSAENMARWDEKVRSIIQQLLLEGGRLVVVREKRDGGIEDAFFRMLLEDENVPGLVSYSENLCALHKTINTRVNS
jgi:protein transport protein SEC24